MTGHWKSIRKMDQLCWSNKMRRLILYELLVPKILEPKHTGRFLMTQLLVNRGEQRDVATAPPTGSIMDRGIPTCWAWDWRTSSSNPQIPKLLWTERVRQLTLQPRASIGNTVTGHSYNLYDTSISTTSNCIKLYKYDSRIKYVLCKSLCSSVQPYACFSFIKNCFPCSAKHGSFTAITKRITQHVHSSFETEAGTPMVRRLPPFSCICESQMSYLFTVYMTWNCISGFSIP